MRFGIGATDSMWPKKRRIRLRVLKAVAILRPRWVQGRRTTRCCLGTHGPPKPLVPSIAEGHLSKRMRDIRLEKGPVQAGRGRPARNSLLELDLGALGLELGLELVGVGLRHAFLDRLRRRLDQVLGLL